MTGDLAASIATCVFVILVAVLVVGALEIGLYVAGVWALRRSKRKDGD